VVCRVGIYSYLVHNHGLIAKNLCLGYWASLLANFVPLGNWLVKLAVYMVNLLVLAVLQSRRIMEGARQSSASEFNRS
jgi:hypothetical protein